MAGVALFDFGLAAYPLYQTSKHVINNGSIKSRDGEVSPEEARMICVEADRWLTFWLTFGLMEVAQGFGADTIPFFHTVKALVLLSLYSREHGVIVSAYLPALCSGYISGTDRARKWWNESAIPQVKDRVSQTGWLNSATIRISGLMGWNESRAPDEQD